MRFRVAVAQDERLTARVPRTRYRIGHRFRAPLGTARHRLLWCSHILLILLRKCAIPLGTAYGIASPPLYPPMRVPLPARWRGLAAATL
jgi:hypothetical protein